MLNIWLFLYNFQICFTLVVENIQSKDRMWITVLLDLKQRTTMQSEGNMTVHTVSPVFPYPKNVIQQPMKTK
jgi:hypothetical protein